MKELQQKCYDIAKEKGYLLGIKDVKSNSEKYRRIMIYLAKLAEEVGEAVKAARNEEFFDLTVNGKPEGVLAELADVCIISMIIAEELDSELHSIIQNKIRYNSTREYKHGKKH